MSSITFGSGSAPSQAIINFDAFFTSTLDNSRKTFIDQISTSNPFLHKVMKGDSYEPADGGTFIKEPLMYALSPTDSYKGYDELSTLPTDGLTDAIYEFRNLANPVVYSMDEIRANRGKYQLINMVKTKMTQSRMGIEEDLGTSIWQGSVNYGGSLTTPRQSLTNLSYFPDPIGKLISITPTSGVVGNIDPSATANAWWRNQTENMTSITTYDQLLLAMENLWINCSLNVGGTPDLIAMDPTTYKLFVFAQYTRYRQTAEREPNYPFEATKFKTAIVVMDEKVPDFGTGVSSYATKGSMVFFNTKFFKMRYDPIVNFEMLKNDAGQSFQKPINGDSRVGHIAWRGQVTLNNRRKQGVAYNIPRTLTA